MNKVEEYISQQNIETQAILQKIRNIIFDISPNAEESISYGMPAYKIKGKVFIYFAAYKKHIGLYATPNTHSAFKNELLKYKQGKGSVQFPFNQSIPYELIEKIIKFRSDQIMSSE